MIAQTIPDVVTSPFGATSLPVQRLLTSRIARMYQQKCNVDVSRCFHGIDEVVLFECQATGYKFWRPESVAGDEALYRMLSAAWPDYYRTERWEHSIARTLIQNRRRVLEIGCGPGVFLKTLEDSHAHAVGLELNEEAIRNKVTTFPILPTSMEELSRRPGVQFDAVYAFQVAEHVIDPHSLIKSALSCLVEGGLLILSVPNNYHASFRQQRDAFDLPPHHVGHFSPEVFRRIGRLMNMRLVSLNEEEHRPTGLMGRLKQMARPSQQSEPGPNLLAAFEKPPVQPSTAPSFDVSAEST